MNSADAKLRSLFFEAIVRISSMSFLMPRPVRFPFFCAGRAVSASCGAASSICGSVSLGRLPSLTKGGSAFFETMTSRLSSVFMMILPFSTTIVIPAGSAPSAVSTLTFSVSEVNVSSVRSPA